MSKIVDYSLEHPQEKFSATDKEKENPYEVENQNAYYDEQRMWDEHKDECNGCALCEL